MRVIEVLGHGCQKCQYVEQLVRETVASLGIDAEIHHVTGDADIAARGILATPGLAIDGRVVMTGRVPTRDQIVAWLQAG